MSNYLFNSNYIKTYHNMGIAYKLIHLITSRIPVSWHKRLSVFYSRYACVSLLRRKGVFTALAEIIFKKYTGQRAHLKRLKKLQDIRKKDVITVVFQVWSLAKWKCDSVYKAMSNHPRFKPVIWITDDPNSPPKEKEKMREKMECFFRKSEYLSYYLENRETLYKHVKPDIIFIQEPYENNYDAVNSVLDEELLCFVCYYVTNTVSKSGHNNFLSLSTLLRFVEKQVVYNEISKILKNKGRNLAIVGHPILDYLREFPNLRRHSINDVWKTAKHGVKKLIWAPHWTITNESFYSNSTFLSICDDMIHIAEKYADQIHIAFKPHPTLYRVLCAHPDWGKERTESYYRQWATMSNTQIEEGEYRELFWESDAMIHDCGSFIIEYPMVNKPCLYLQRGGIEYGDFNEFAKAALACYTIGSNIEDVEKFIREQVILGHDSKKEVRKQFIENYLSPYCEKTAAENIIDSILTK